MGLQEIIKTAKSAYHANAVADIRSRAQSKGLSANETNTLLAAIPATIVALHDGYTVHFYGEDASIVANRLGIEVDTAFGMNHCLIDSRQWNRALGSLTAHGLIVTQTEALGLS